jgi:signal transduction histidine kinase
MTVRSIRARLLLYITLVQILVTITGAWFVIVHTRRESLAAFDANLAERARSLVPLMEADENSGKIIFHSELSALPSGDCYRIADSDGRRVAEVPGCSLLPTAPVNGRPIANLSMLGVPYRALDLRNLNLPSGEEQESGRPLTINIVYASPMTPVLQHLRRVALFAALACLAMLIFSLAACLWAINVGLRPLARLASEASKIDVDHWAFDPSPNVTRVRELMPLTDSLTLLVNRLKLAFERERQLFGDAAHELKTAIAILKSTLQLSLHLQDSTIQYRAGLTRGVEDTERLEALVSKMLQLAALEHSSSNGYSLDTSADLSRETEIAVEQLRSMAAAREVTLLLKPHDGLDVAVAADDLRSLIINIVENAIQHSPKESAVEITLSANHTACLAVVRDHGPGISAAALPHIFGRFYRGDSSRARTTGGFGLGLSIAQAIARRAGGDITAATLDEGGSVFTVCLPKACNSFRRA